MKFIITASIVSLMSIGSALACSCAEWTNARDLLKNADSAVLVVPVADSVVDPTAPREHEFSGPTMKTSMKVVRNFKGKYSKFFYLFSEKGDGANCGVDFKKHDGVYLVFAYHQNGRYYTSSCDLRAVDSEDKTITKILADLLP